MSFIKYTFKRESSLSTRLVEAAFCSSRKRRLCSFRNISKTMHWPASTNAMMIYQEYFFKNEIIYKTNI